MVKGQTNLALNIRTLSRGLRLLTWAVYLGKYSSWTPIGRFVNSTTHYAAFIPGPISLPGVTPSITPSIHHHLQMTTPRQTKNSEPFTFTTEVIGGRPSQE